jgi:hypothetical protein
MFRGEKKDRLIYNSLGGNNGYEALAPDRGILILALGGALGGPNSDRRRDLRLFKLKRKLCVFDDRKAGQFLGPLFECPPS